jgi:hypothetical protein
LERGLRDITAHCQAEHERRMALEALVGGKCFCPFPDLMPAFGFLAPNIDSSVSRCL